MENKLRRSLITKYQGDKDCSLIHVSLRILLTGQQRREDKGRRVGLILEGLKDMFLSMSFSYFVIKALIPQIHECHSREGRWLLQFPSHWAVTLFINSSKGFKAGSGFKR